MTNIFTVLMVTPIFYEDVLFPIGKGNIASKGGKYVTAS